MRRIDSLTQTRVRLTHVTSQVSPASPERIRQAWAGVPMQLVSENTHRTVASCPLNAGQISTMLFNAHRARFRLTLTKRPRSRFCCEVSHACADSREVNHARADFHLSTHRNLVSAVPLDSLVGARQCSIGLCRHTQ
jgi:hypothetical protein